MAKTCYITLEVYDNDAFLAMYDEDGRPVSESLYNQRLFEGDTVTAPANLSDHKRVFDDENAAIEFLNENMESIKEKCRNKNTYGMECDLCIFDEQTKKLLYHVDAGKL